MALSHQIVGCVFKISNAIEKLVRRKGQRNTQSKNWGGERDRGIRNRKSGVENSDKLNSMPAIFRKAFILSAGIPEYHSGSLLHCADNAFVNQGCDYTSDQRGNDKYPHTG